MSSTIEFTTRAHSATCDSCGRPTQAGFYHLVAGSPVLFDCVPCATRLVGQQAITEAIEDHKHIAFLRMEAAAEEAQGGQW